jgi:hypothetical protein
VIAAATIRAQISQIENYQTAVNAFKDKYNCLPGDCINGTAFGFPPRGTFPGSGDGNGLIMSTQCGSSAYTPNTVFQADGETAVFWVDLSMAGLIDGAFTMATETDSGANTAFGTNQDLIGAAVGTYFPQGKIQGHYVYVFSIAGLNYFGIANVTGISSCSHDGYLTIGSDTGLTVQQAYAIDTKMDDGMPGTGKALAFGVLYGGWPGWAGYGGGSTTGDTNITGYDVVPSETSCFDNSLGNDTSQHYSTQINNGNGNNCALSFQFE